MTDAEQLLVGLVMAAGLVGILLPVIPGLLLIWAAGLWWTIADGGGPVRWTVFGVLTVAARRRDGGEVRAAGPLRHRPRRARDLAGRGARSARSSASSRSRSSACWSAVSAGSTWPSYARLRDGGRAWVSTQAALVAIGDRHADRADRRRADDRRLAARPARHLAVAPARRVTFRSATKDRNGTVPASITSTVRTARPAGPERQVHRGDQVGHVEEAVHRADDLDHRGGVGEVLQRHRDQHQDDQPDADHVRHHPVAGERARSVRSSAGPSRSLTGSLVQPGQVAVVRGQLRVLLVADRGPAPAPAPGRDAGAACGRAARRRRAGGPRRAPPATTGRPRRARRPATAARSPCSAGIGWPPPGRHCHTPSRTKTTATTMVSACHASHLGASSRRTRPR